MPKFSAQVETTQFNCIKTMHLEPANHQAILIVCFGFFISIAGHVTHLPVWVSLFIGFSLIWRLSQNMNYVPALARWLIVPFVLAGGIGVFATYWTITGRDAGLALLSVMAAFKLLESQTQRDALIVVFLSYFLVATHFLFSQSIFIAIYMMLTLLFLTASLITLNERNLIIPWKVKLKISASIIAYALPLMVILFILVPRVPGPLWGLTHEQRSGVTGLSDHMSPGKISDLIQDNSIAFRVSFKGDIPPQSDLYWRGPVMSRFNGETWFQTTRKTKQLHSIKSTGKRYEYTMTLEGNGKKWLLPLDLPTGSINGSTLTSDFELKNNQDINDLKKYDLISYSKSSFGENEIFDVLMKNTEFPDNKNPKTIQYGRKLRERFTDDKALVAYVLEQFSQQQYFYTLSPPSLGVNPMDDFLFNTKRGFCEHYAGSFALIMRAANIPSRIVTGYQGGELNTDGHYLMVRQSDAHAWTEVWYDDEGWTRVDPTAAVSPDRIEKSIDDALKDEDVSFRFNTKNSMIGDLLSSWDNIQHNWNNWVLNYNQAKQSQFLKKLGIGIKSTGDMVIALVIALTTMTLSYALFSWIKNQPPKPAFFELLYQRLLKKTLKAGFPIKTSESPTEYLDRVLPVITLNTQHFKHAILLYMRIKYSASQNKPALVKQLEAAITKV